MLEETFFGSSIVFPPSLVQTLREEDRDSIERDIQEQTEETIRCAEVKVTSFLHPSKSEHVISLLDCGATTNFITETTVSSLLNKGVLHPSEIFSRPQDLSIRIADQSFMFSNKVVTLSVSL